MISEESTHRKPEAASNWLMNLDKIEDRTRRNYFSGLPPEQLLLDYYTNAFVINKPKGRVGGDAYWLHAHGDDVYLALFTCVGEGHLAHMMIRIYMNALKKMVDQYSIDFTGSILQFVHREVQSRFNNKNNILLNTNANIGIVKLNMKTKAMEFAGANMDLIQMARDGARVIKGEKHQVGDHGDSKPTYSSIALKDTETSTFYLCSSGVYNLIGGPNYKKLPMDKWLEFLQSIQRNPVTGHKEYIEKYLTDWTGANRQNDDIMVIGFTA